MSWANGVPRWCWSDSDVNTGRRIVFITHESDRFWQRSYLVHLMIARWKALGFEVAVTSDAFIPADVAFLHTDLSVVPESCRRLAAKYPAVINRSVTDVRKRAYSRLTVTRDGPDPGPVIVKSDWNCGGARDFRRLMLESRLARLLAPIRLDRAWYHLIAAIERKRSWRKRRLLRSRCYRVYPSRAQVPAGVWDNPHLVVERFVAEREGSYYCCRHWLFMGSKEVSRRTRSLEPIIKASAGIEALTDPVPEALRALRKRLGFDYGKFDYGLVDGEVFLYDANPTPGRSASPERHANTIDTLSTGIEEFIGSAVSPLSHCTMPIIVPS
ncbi:MAG TPA: hypothetical protein GYA07_15540 [Verrucomicrobia bacterium]|nr:hypothetical protein [Verrucomicrobiota bacterium]HOP96606.1 hypothetical protein [Verrucomicrobiota bacterium]